MNRNDIYNRITDKLIEKISSGTVPWRRSWSVGVPSNFITKRVYNGINFISLLLDDYPSPYYLTYLQCQQLKGKVNSGEKGSLIVFGKCLR